MDVSTMELLGIIGGVATAFLGSKIAHLWFEDRRNRVNATNSLMSEKAERAQQLLKQWESAISGMMVYASGFLSGEMSYQDFLDGRDAFYSSDDGSMNELDELFYNYFPTAVPMKKETVEAVSKITSMVHHHRRRIGDSDVQRDERYDNLLPLWLDAEEKLHALRFEVGAVLRKHSGVA
jgi:hypothetical protein